MRAQLEAWIVGTAQNEVKSASQADVHPEDASQTGEEDRRPVAPKYVHLQCAVSGNSFCYAGVGSSPDYLIPAYTFQIQDLIGNYLLAVEFGSIKNDGDSPVLSDERVSGVIDPQDRI